MPIISTIGRRAWKVRALIATIYVLLITGAVTMVYPFLLMIAGSTKSSVDTPDPAVIPPFLVDDTALYQKYVEGLFNESLEAARFAYGTDAPSFGRLAMPANLNRELVADWLEFLERTPLPLHAYELGFIHVPLSRGTLPQYLRAFKNELNVEYAGDLARMNSALGSAFPTWNAFYLLPQAVLLPQERPGTTGLHQRYAQFKAQQPVSHRNYVSVAGFFKVQVLQNRYGKNVAGYNQSHGTAYASWQEIRLDRRLPADPGRTDKERQDWQDFVRSLVNLTWVRADDGAAPAYRAFLEAKYGDIATLNRNYGTAHAAFADVPVVADPPMFGLVRSDWDAFVEGWKDPATGRLHQAPAEHLRIHSVEFLFQDFLREKHGTLERLHAAQPATRYTAWEQILPPQQDLHYQAFLEQRGALRWEFVKRNYLSVLDYVALHGRAVVNTAIYCTLLIAVTLLVNPIAAYALSRYRPPSAYKVLLFLMLTMAFPPMVTQIPVFLMLREFNLLNTFWALILPGIANGYSIFLLKGFFDSLPRELYESAELDGASEFRIFWQLTMSLSKPILAVIALNAFTAAYSNFMYALLICQDENMWTLMPWLYQLQQRSAQGVVFASLLIASVPTFLLFVFCQKIIMRGIVVPVEK